MEYSSKFLPFTVRNVLSHSSLDKVCSLRPFRLIFPRLLSPLFCSFLSKKYLVSTGQPYFPTPIPDQHVCVTAIGSCSMHAAGTSQRALAAKRKTARTEQDRYHLSQLLCNGVQQILHQLLLVKKVPPFASPYENPCQLSPIPRGIANSQQFLAAGVLGRQGSRSTSSFPIR
ncbi:hypothetical protein PICMEDRAFT_95722 [Pichia membranifaciens NRRL Y-2026]|uniref:Uncharacterized protein n=1 Tax=Pichia membranifaciens NRRL Y-2026 TaxID=763406 RepID=A0A1E3NU80_9ASCO|nr:hypothetical protein PICMEDRAFT_95722 [Pichia membranifaciens NRRL Y-2026]ODQ49123.1 hypothetical protein PICMEDRAFT_95722 [Pichia membranifaciens NRRL Y-2026]